MGNLVPHAHPHAPDSVPRRPGRPTPFVDGTARSPRTVESDGHVPRSWFRYHVWKPAVGRAKLNFRVRVHDLRHAHASWLLAGGTDIQVVKERLGHGSLRATERYLHTLPDADESALHALAKIRNRRG